MSSSRTFGARMRPVDIVELSGKERFTPWWDPRGDCPDNCSFVAGEASGGFWTLAPAALTPPQWRAFAYARRDVFGAAMGVLRMAGGGHFFTDVVFAGVLMFLLVWIVHGPIIAGGRPGSRTRRSNARSSRSAGDARRLAALALSRRERQSRPHRQRNLGHRTELASLSRLPIVRANFGSIRPRLISLGFHRLPCPKAM